MLKSFSKTSILLLLATASVAAQPQPGTVIWSFDVGAPGVSSPTLAPDGTIYLAALGLSAVTNNGVSASNRWTVQVSGSPALGPDGTIYCSSDGVLTAVNPDGSVKWTYSDGTRGGLVEPAVASDGTVYYVGNAELRAISPSGIKKWSRNISTIDGGGRSPVIGADGTVYVCGSLALFAFSADGTNKWSYPLFAFGPGSSALGNGGIIYAAADQLFAFNPDGSRIWSMGTLFDGSPTIGKDGTLYAIGVGRGLYAVSPSGQGLWYTLTDAPRYGEYTAPATDAGGRIYYCISNTVWALNPQGQVQWTVGAYSVPDPRFDVANTSPIIGPDGTLYAALGTRLYAITTGTNGPADSPWPMDRGNAQHSGRIQKPSLLNPKKRADANFEFQLFSQVGQNVSIESSTNLAAWDPLTNLVPAVVPEPVVDLSASNSPVKFYRAKAGG